MRVALLLKGAISKTTGKSSHPDQVYRDGGYVNYVAGAKSIRRHIVDANPDCEFDFFLHSWHPDLNDELVDLYSPIACLSESCVDYRDQVLDVLSATDSREQFYGQVSMCLSIKKVTALLQDHVKETLKEYDLVVFYRYDLLLWKDMLLSEYSPENIYVNGDARCRGIGDFHFVMSYDNAIKFGSGLYDSISIENPPKDHKVIKGFVEGRMDSHLTTDGIIAGEHQEVIRKLMLMVTAKKVSVDALESFGITIKELESYNCIT